MKVRKEFTRVPQGDASLAATLSPSSCELQPFCLFVLIQTIWSSESLPS